MKEVAEVVECLNNNIARVILKRTSACGECRVCSPKKKIIVTVRNKVNAKVGDIVNIEIKTLKKTALFFVYIMPLILLFLGYGIGFLIFRKETPSVLFSILLPALYIVIAIIIEKRKKAISGEIINIAQ